MVELYGPAFVSAYGESPSPLWLAAITELTDAECRDGLTRLAREAREYPANLTQFVAACRPEQGVRYLGNPVTPADLDRMLPPPERRAKPEVIDRWIAKMRRTVGAAVSADQGGREPSKACTCMGLGECEVCKAWAQRMLAYRESPAAKGAQ
jgi:hypothetical protein